MSSSMKSSLGGGGGVCSLVGKYEKEGGYKKKSFSGSRLNIQRIASD